jgi:hypothetical protein
MDVKIGRAGSFTLQGRSGGGELLEAGQFTVVQLLAL